MYLFQIRIFREIALRTALVFVILGSVASSTQVLGHIFAMIDAGSNILVPLELFFYLIPTVAVMILPVAFLIACISTFDRMDDSWETIVLAATGVRPVTVVFPIILFALAISAFVLAISIYVEPIANKAERDKVVSFKVDALTLLASNGVMQKTQANLYIRGGALRDDGQIQDIFILDRRSPDDEVIYFAETGKIIKDQSRILLRLVDGSIQHHSHIDGTSYTFRFGEYSSESEVVFERDDKLVYQPRQIATFDLVAKLNAFEGSYQSKGEVRKELVRRFTDWIYPFVYLAVVLFLVYGVGFTRTTRKWRMTIAILIGTVAKAVGLILLGKTGTAQSATTMSFVVPVALLLIFVTIALYRNQRPAGQPPI